MQINASRTTPFKADGEVDLSADLMDIFFAGDQDSEIGEESEFQSIPEVAEEAPIEAYPEGMQPPPAKSAQEQLQEVDFYIRLGFHDEALAKLNEIAKLNPDNPELASRYQKLGSIAPDPAAGMPEKPECAGWAWLRCIRPNSIRLKKKNCTRDGKSMMRRAVLPSSIRSRRNPNRITEPLSAASFPSAESFGAWSSEEPQTSTGIAALESDASDFQANEMFADLMDGVGGASGEDVSVDSFENHFSLGTAYREMELMDEAIKEFESALKAANAQKDAKRTIQCCGMLSTCYLKKGMPSSALRWCQTGLGIADNSSHEAMALRYDMGVAHSMSGSNERALECFDRIFGMDPGYRDVAQKIDELKSGSNRHAP